MAEVLLGASGVRRHWTELKLVSCRVHVSDLECFRCFRCFKWFDDLWMFINVYQCLSTFINVYQCFRWFHSGAISTNCCALWGWFHFSGRPSKNQKHHRHFWTNPWCFSAAFGNAHRFFFLKPLTGDPRQILQPVASGTYGCANGCMGKDSHVRPAGEVSIPKKATLQSAIMPECFDQAK